MWNNDNIGLLVFFFALFCGMWVLNGIKKRNI